MNKLIAVTAALVFLAVLALCSWMHAPAPTRPEADVIILRDQLAAAWRAREFSDEQYHRKQRELFALQRAFAGCVCQGAR